MQAHPYAVWLSLAALAAAIAAQVAWRRRRATAGRPLFVLLLASAVWAATYALTWLSTDLADQIFWLNATYFGVVVIPLALLAFTLQYTGKGDWLTRRRLGWLAIQPILTFLVVWSNPLHYWFHASFMPLELGGFVALGWTRGPWFWFNVVYSYGMLLAAFVLLLREMAQVPPGFRSQIRMIVIAFIWPWVASIVTQFGLNPWPELDLTPIAFSLTGILILYGLYFHRLLDLVPVARSQVLENMQDGVLVLDLQRRVVDMNPAANAMLGVTRQQAIGEPVEAAFVHFPQALEVFLGKGSAQDVARLPGNPDRYIDVRLSRLEDKAGRRLGYLVVGRDITDAHLREEELRQANQRLQGQFKEIQTLQVELREQAIRDPLTGLHNRRFLDEALLPIFETAVSNQQPVSMVMVDLDRFKNLNDEYGHHAGDLVLQQLAQLLMRFSRGGDVVCRYGGEEILAVLPGVGAEVAARRVEEWRAAWAGLVIEHADHRLQTTFSAGVAAFPIHGTDSDDVLRAADRALYAAKDAGRNRVAVAEGE